MIDLTKHPILVSVSLPIFAVLQLGFEPFWGASVIVFGLIGLAVWLFFAAQVFFKANRSLDASINPVFVVLALGAWPLIIASIATSSTVNADPADIFEVIAVLMAFGSIGVLLGNAAVALERAEKGEAKVFAVAGSMLQLYFQMFCAVQVCARLERLDKSAIRWK